MKIKLSKKQMRKTIIWFIIADLSLGLWSFVRYQYHKPNEALRYPYQLTCIVMAVCIFCFLWQLRKLFPKTVTAQIMKKLTRLYTRFVSGPLSKVYSMLRKVFGLPEYRRKRGKDEKSFIFDLENTDLFRRFQSVKNQLRWRDLETNGQKIRYLFIKYMVKLIKSGYRFQSYKTPDEMREELSLKPEPERLFVLYTGARYGEARYPVSDEDVEMAAKLVKK